MSSDSQNVNCLLHHTLILSLVLRLNSHHVPNEERFAEKTARVHTCTMAGPSRSEPEPVPWAEGQALEVRKRPIVYCCLMR